MDRGVCHRARVALSAKPVLPLFSLFITMVAVGCMVAGVVGNSWMKNTTNYGVAVCPFLGAIEFAVLDATVHLNPRTMWMSFTTQMQYDSPSFDVPEVVIDFHDLHGFPAADGFNQVSSTITLLTYISLALVSVETVLIMILCCALIMSSKCSSSIVCGLKTAVVILALPSFLLPTVSVAWWSITVPNPADLLVVTASYGVNMTIDGDMGWSAVLPILGGCSMLVVVLLMAVYLPPQTLNPLDAALNASEGEGEGQLDYSQEYISEDVGFVQEGQM